MAKSAAQRQAEYRARHLKDVEGNCERLSVIIDIHAKYALERLASCYGVTQKAMLEMLLQEAENDALKSVGALRTGDTDYYDKRIRLDFVTQ